MTRQAERELRTENYTAAEELLLTQVSLQPDDAKAWAKLGETRYRLGRFDDATEALNRALALDPKLGAAYAYLGIIAEEEGNLDEALAQYRKFLAVERRGTRAKSVAHRFERLRKEAAQRFARDQLSREAELKVSAIPDSSVGVVYFDNRHLAEHLQPLNKGLAEMLTTDLAQVRSLVVLERLKLEKLKQELELTQSPAFDTTTAPRWGRLLGAARLVAGELSELTDNRLRLDPHLVTTATGDVDIASSQTGALGDFFRMEKRLVFAILDRLGVEYSAEERDAISAVPTESMVAFLAYCRGLDYQDRGFYDEAAVEYERAVREDPGFKDAQTKLDITQPLRGGLEPSRTLKDFSNVVVGTGTTGEGDAALEDRLTSLGESMGMIPSTDESPESSDSGEGAEPYTGAFGGSGIGTGTVNIQGTFDDRGGGGE